MSDPREKRLTPAQRALMAFLKGGGRVERLWPSFQLVFNGTPAPKAGGFRIDRGVTHALEQRELARWSIFHARPNGLRYQVLELTEKGRRIHVA